MLVTPLEFAASLTVTVSIILAARNNVHTWWTGIVSCFLLGLLFWRFNLYADVALQFFYVITGLIGWWRWTRGDKGGELPITRSNPLSFIWIIPLGVVATVLYGSALYFTTDAYAPYPDSAVLVFSVIAQLLLMQRKLESWYFWLVVNTIAVPLYLSRELYLTSLLYAAYWVNAVFAIRNWRQLMQAKCA